MFLYAGTLYSWGIFQAELARRQLASSLLLSTVGGLQAFCQAIGCMPVSHCHLLTLYGTYNQGITFSQSDWSIRNCSSRNGYRRYQYDHG
jgi:hypothetical protein